MNEMCSLSYVAWAKLVLGDEQYRNWFDKFLYCYSVEQKQWLFDGEVERRCLLAERLVSSEIISSMRCANNA